MSIARNECFPFRYLFCWGNIKKKKKRNSFKNQSKFACKVTAQIKQRVPALQRDQSSCWSWILSGTEGTASLLYLKATVMLKWSHFFSTAVSQ